MIEKLKPTKTNLNICLKAFGYVVKAIPDEGTLYKHESLPEIMVYDGETEKTYFPQEDD